MAIENVDGKMRRFRTYYPDTRECIDVWAENQREPYTASLIHGGRGIISVETPDGWREILGFEHPSPQVKK